MEPTITIIVAICGCTAFWQLIDHLIEARRKQKFDIEAAVQDVQKDMVTLKENQESMQRSIASLSHQMGEERAITSRVRILSFADDMMSDREHSKDSFDQVLADIDSYDHYCSEHPHFKNNKTALSKELIIEQYRECEREGTFLQQRRKKREGSK